MSNTMHSSQVIINNFKKFKWQGLTNHQAKIQLEQIGYTTVQITDASNAFDYLSYIPDTSDEQIQITDARTFNRKYAHAHDEADKDFVDAGGSILAEKKRNARPFTYLSFALSGSFIGTGISRFWLDRKQVSVFNFNPLQVLSDRMMWQLLAALSGGIIALIPLKMYFYLNDRKYKQKSKKELDRI